MAFYKINKFITLSNHIKQTKLTLADHLSLRAQIDSKTKDDTASQVPQPLQTNNLSNINVHLPNKQSKISLQRIYILINEKKSIQCGGAQSSCTSSRSVKNLKVVNEYITWATALYFRCSINYITCYIPPRNNESSSQLINHLDRKFRQIQEKEANSKINVMSDFSRDHIIKVQKIMAQYNLIPIIQDQQKNIAGNRLDQIFSNIPVEDFQILKTEVSDDDTLLVTLKLLLKANGIDMNNLETFQTQQVVRFYLKIHKARYPLRLEIEGQLIKREKVSRRYTAPPKWFNIIGIYLKTRTIIILEKVYQKVVIARKNVMQIFTQNRMIFQKPLHNATSRKAWVMIILMGPLYKIQRLKILNEDEATILPGKCKATPPIEK
ncbi:UNKNOWN [Stylonychia lemnae]|uniref:Uncharacterized protein n=1 Tax=Stylonychia lemnae TaxID=5949 RepID=A0A078APP5_STYLE|nr:UNKNOWN [Stylonychia lemnae]|eukprot:CDW83277.1 UNKNOWN [Stylonychia lemnae]